MNKMATSATISLHEPSFLLHTVRQRTALIKNKKKLFKILPSFMQPSKSVKLSKLIPSRELKINKSVKDASAAKRDRIKSTMAVMVNAFAVVFKQITPSVFL